MTSGAFVYNRLTERRIADYFFHSVFIIYKKGGCIGKSFF